MGDLWSNLGPSGAFLESFLSLLFFLEPFWALLLPSSGSLGHVFVRSWSRSGHFWGNLGIYLGPSCGLSWTILGLCGVILGDLWANLRPSGAFLELCVVFFGQLWLKETLKKSCVSIKQWQNSSGTFVWALVWTTCWPFLRHSRVLCSSCLLAVPFHD